MEYIPKELEENQLRFEFVMDPDTKGMTMKTYIDDTSERVELNAEVVVSKDPLMQSKAEQVDFEKMSELDQLIYEERQRLLNLRPPNKIVKEAKAKDTLYDCEVYETGFRHQLTQKEKSRLRMRRLREIESAEDHEYRKFRGRVLTMKSRLLQKLRNFEDETYLNEINKRASDKIKQMRLKLKANETPAQEELRKKQDNLARRKLFLRNKLFRTSEDILRKREMRTKCRERARARRSEEQCIAKRKLDAEKAKAKRKQNNKEWESIQRAIKGQKVENIQVTVELTDKVL